MHQYSSVTQTEFEHTILENVAYFDTAGRSVQPKTVEMIGVEALKQKSYPWKGLRGGEEDVRDIRRLFGELINAPAETISYSPSTAFAMTLAARNSIRCGKLREGKSVLVVEKEMASVVYPWQYACKEVGGNLKVVKFPSDESCWSDEIIRLIDENVAVVALGLVHWCDGSDLEIEKISAYLQSLDESMRPYLIIDGTQYIGCAPFDVQNFHATFVACSVHKWLLSPYGLSLTYLHPNLHNIWGPLDYHERSRVGKNEAAWDEEVFMTVHGYPEEYCIGAAKLDSGGHPNPVCIPAVKAALKLILEWKPTLISLYTKKLNDYLWEQLEKCCPGYFSVCSKRSPHILGVRLTEYAHSKGFSLQYWKRSLIENNIFVSIRGGCLRISPYIYTTFSHVNKFIATTAQLIKYYFVNSTLLAKKRVLLTGSTGWLAQNIFQQFIASNESNYELHVSFNRSCPSWALSSHRWQLDLGCSKSIEFVLDAVKPDVIIHLAAISSPVKCDMDPEEAYKTNCPILLTHALRRINGNCLFIYSSTDMVYDGFTAPYTEEAPTSPVNTYGKTKLAFEQEVLSFRNSFVLRLSNMLGIPYVYAPAGEKFFEWLYNCFLQRKCIGLKDDEIRSFVYVEDVSKFIIEKIGEFVEGILSPQLPKIFNIGGPVGLSRLDIAKILCNAKKCELYTNTPEYLSSADEDESKWRVYIMDSSSSNAVISPKNIAMDVSLATAWKFRATHPQVYLKTILEEIENWSLEALDRKQFNDFKETSKS
jgi:selenocysteine lyase/cysteine desulfurase/dTDP-4-dehydrorhamnose reductase